MARVCALLAVMCACAQATHAQRSYAIVVDGGSTGSRLFVYEAVGNDTRTREVNGIKGLKVSPGLSEFGLTPHDVVPYMIPLFEHAAQLIPPEHHSSARVYIKATAGMRLLPKEQRVAVYDALCDGLSRDSRIPFQIHRQNVGTITGDLEAYYAVLSANYIGGRMDESLSYIPNSGPVIGALDMGGSSTQIVFYTGDSAERGQSFKSEDFWSQSFLSYGVGGFRERVWAHLIQLAGAEGKSNIENPCDFAGREEVAGEITLRGSGKPDACIELIQNVLWPDGECISPPCAVDGVRAPRVRGEFYGMSVFFYGLNAIHKLGPKSLPWPKPTLTEVFESTASFCELHWDSVKNDLVGVHAYTSDDQLPYRCLEALYMGVLLRDGYGFDPATRDITLALEVEGMEVEWTLGYALAELEHTRRATIGVSTAQSKTTASEAQATDAAMQELFSNLLRPRQFVNVSLSDWVREMNNSLQGYIDTPQLRSYPPFALTAIAVVGGALLVLLHKRKKF